MSKHSHKGVSIPWTQGSIWSSAQPVVLFDYAPSRSAGIPRQLLEDYQGAIMVDGFEGYDGVCRGSTIVRLGCWSHARRKFIEAAKAQGKSKKSTKADYGLKLINKLYTIERQLKDVAADERHSIRNEKARPVLDKLHAWLMQTLSTAPPKLALGKALSYLHIQWPQLIRYLEDGHYPIDNNRIENAIRPFALGSNWLFSACVDGAKASANLYSMMETAKACQLEPYAYLKRVLTDLPNAESVKEIEKLLPWNYKPESQ